MFRLAESHQIEKAYADARAKIQQRRHHGRRNNLQQRFGKRRIQRIERRCEKRISCCNGSRFIHAFVPVHMFII